MNLAEVGRLLAFIARVDNRKPDDATAIVWHGIIGDLPYDDALTAVRNHFATNTEYLTPAHIHHGVLAIRRERVAHHEIRALPSRFEPDDERAARVRRGIAECARALSVATERKARAQTPADPTDRGELIRLRAIDRARRERHGQPA
jgi:hypothetical protein